MHLIITELSRDRHTRGRDSKSENLLGRWDVDIVPNEGDSISVSVRGQDPVSYVVQSRAWIFSDEFDAYDRKKAKVKIVVVRKRG